MKRNDKGFSLIELVVVIAMMAIALSVGGMALSNITLANAKRSAGEIKSYMEYVRMESLKTSANKQLTLEIYEDEEGNVMLRVGSNEEKKIGNSNVRIQYVDDNGQTYELGNTILAFEFDRGSGAFSQMDAKKVLISGAGREFVLTCYEKTGKVTLE